MLKRNRTWFLLCYVLIAVYIPVVLVLLNLGLGTLYELTPFVYEYGSSLLHGSLLAMGGAAFTFPCSCILNTFRLLLYFLSSWPSMQVRVHLAVVLCWYVVTIIYYLNVSKNSPPINMSMNRHFIRFINLRPASKLGFALFKLHCFVFHRLDILHCESNVFPSAPDFDWNSLY